MQAFAVGATLAVMSLGVGSAPASASQKRAHTRVEVRAVGRQLRDGAVLSNLAPRPAFISGCSAALHSLACASGELAAIDHARRNEGLPAMRMNPATWARLSPIVQVFIATNLERIARGLVPAAALSRELNAAARVGANDSVDPTLPSWVLPGGSRVRRWGANWAGGLNPLQADYLWMYDDGVGYNIECTSPTSPGCWGHRMNILLASTTAASCEGSQPALIMGVGIKLRAYHGSTGIGQLLAATCGGLPTDSTVRWTTLAHRLRLPAN